MSTNVTLENGDFGVLLRAWDGELGAIKVVQTGTYGTLVRDYLGNLVYVAPPSCPITASLWVGGWFQRFGGLISTIGRYSGGRWYEAGEGQSTQTAYAFCELNDELYALGIMFSDNEATAFQRIMKWDSGSEKWIADPAVGFNNTVYHAIVWDNKIVATGLFTTAGGNAVNYIAWYDGTNWGTFDTGLNGYGYRLSLYGDTFAVGGSFTQDGGATKNLRRIAIWNTSTNTFDEPEGGASSTVYGLAEHGSKLAACGNCTFGAVAAQYVSTFNGTAWEDLNGDLFNSYCYKTESFQGKLYVAGAFSQYDGDTDVHGIAVLDEATTSWNKDFDPNNYYGGVFVASGRIAKVGDSYLIFSGLNQWTYDDTIPAQLINVQYMRCWFDGTDMVPQLDALHNTIFSSTEAAISYGGYIWESVSGTSSTQYLTRDMCMANGAFKFDPDYYKPIRLHEKYLGIQRTKNTGVPGAVYPLLNVMELPTDVRVYNCAVGGLTEHSLQTYDPNTDTYPEWPNANEYSYFCTSPFGVPAMAVSLTGSNYAYDVDGRLLIMGGISLVGDGAASYNTTYGIYAVDLTTGTVDLDYLKDVNTGGNSWDNYLIANINGVLYMSLYTIQLNGDVNDATMNCAIRYTLGSDWEPIQRVGVGDPPYGVDGIAMVIMQDPFSSDILWGGYLVQTKPDNTTLNGLARLRGDTFYQFDAAGPGVNGVVYGMYLDPADGKLIIYGSFTQIDNGAQASYYMAKWDGSTWYPMLVNMGADMPDYPTGNSNAILTVFRHKGVLYVGATFGWRYGGFYSTEKGIFMQYNEDEDTLENTSIGPPTYQENLVCYMGELEDEPQPSSSSSV